MQVLAVLVVDEGVAPHHGYDEARPQQESHEVGQLHRRGVDELGDAREQEDDPYGPHHREDALRRGVQRGNGEGGGAADGWPPTGVVVLVGGGGGEGGGASDGWPPTGVVVLVGGGRGGGVGVRWGMHFIWRHFYCME